MPVPMIDDLELRAVQLVRTETEQGYARHRIAGLDGTLHQHVGRRSHRVLVAGLLVGKSSEDDLATLQAMASDGDEVTFAGDISTALEIDQMVVENFAAEQGVGDSTTAFALMLAESPALPPPAEVSAFGGLGDFGLGDMGFDPESLGDTLGDIAEQASAAMDAADSALAAIEQLNALANLADLGSLSNPAKPIADALGTLSDMRPAITDAAGRVTE